MSSMEWGSTRVCACQTGVYYVRPCGQPALHQCGNCGLDLCEAHARQREPGAWFCPDCLTVSSQTAGSAFSSHPARTGSASSAYDGIGWAGVNDGAVFAEEDYAAFDALSEFDMKADQDHAYDS